MSRSHSFHLFSKRCWIILLISVLFCLPGPAHGTIRYYYLHVGSLRSEGKAIQYAQKLQKEGLNTVVRGTDIPKKGYWYRIYVGPFFSRLEAELKSRELKKKGLTDYAAIHKKSTLLMSHLEKEEKLPDQKIPPPAPEVMVSKPPPPIAEPIPVQEPPIKLPPKSEEIAEAELPSPEIPPTEKEIPVKPHGEVQTRKESPRPPPKPPVSKMKRGHGRNPGQGHFAVTLEHTFRDISTEVTKREQVTSDGVTTTTTTPVLSNPEKDDFPTQLHMDSLRVHIGLTDYLEVFADIGFPYDKPDEMGTATGAGLRLNLFELRRMTFTRFYGAIQGAFLSGDFEEEYHSDVGNKWRRKTDWEEICADVEFGLTRPRFTAYLGGSYFYYQEDTQRRQLENIPAPFVFYEFQDELDPDQEFGVYGGLAIHVTGSLDFHLEGRALNQLGITAGLTYFF